MRNERRATGPTETTCQGGFAGIKVRTGTEGVIVEYQSNDGDYLHHPYGPARVVIPRTGAPRWEVFRDGIDEAMGTGECRWKYCDAEGAGQRLCCLIERSPRSTMTVELWSVVWYPPGPRVNPVPEITVNQIAGQQPRIHYG